LAEGVNVTIESIEASLRVAALSPTVVAISRLRVALIAGSVNAASVETAVGIGSFTSGVTAEIPVVPVHATPISNRMIGIII